MKKQIIAAGLVIFAIAVRAQEPPPKPPTIEERIKKTSEVIQQEVKPTEVQKAAIEQIFKQFFTAADKLRKDNPPPPPPPPDPKVKEAMDKLVKDRDESIKKLLTASQYEKYKQAAKKLQPPGPGERNPPQQ